jgi:hypothetical protein
MMRIASVLAVLSFASVTLGGAPAYADQAVRIAFQTDFAPFVYVHGKGNEPRDARFSRKGASLDG